MKLNVAIEKNRSGFSGLRPFGMLRDANLRSRVQVFTQFPARIFIRMMAIE